MSRVCIWAGRKGGGDVCRMREVDHMRGSRRVRAHLDFLDHIYRFVTRARFQCPHSLYMCTCFADCCWCNSILTSFPPSLSPPVGSFIPCTPMSIRDVVRITESGTGLQIGELVVIVGRSQGRIVVLTVANGRVEIDEEVRSLLHAYSGDSIIPLLIHPSAPSTTPSFIGNPGCGSMNYGLVPPTTPSSNYTPNACVLPGCDSRGCG